MCALLQVLSMYGEVYVFLRWTPGERTRHQYGSILTRHQRHLECSRQYSDVLFCTKYQCLWINGKSPEFVNICLRRGYDAFFWRRLKTVFRDSASLARTLRIRGRVACSEAFGLWTRTRPSPGRVHVDSPSPRTLPSPGRVQSPGLWNFFFFF